MPPTWEQLYNSHGDALVLYARQFVPAQAEAEDVVHDAFVKLFSKRKIRRHPNPKALLFQSVRWTALDRLKSDLRRQKRETEAATDLFDCHVVSITGDEDSEFSATISRLLQSLPDDQREVLVLHLWADLSFREIADQLDISANTAASRYRYGLEKLRSGSSELLDALPDQISMLTLD